MSAAAVRRVVARLGPGDTPTDAELVAALAPGGADREAAFARLVGRHGPMVLGACRGLLGHAHDAEDAFQAVFLVLARKSNTIRPPGAVGGWLYGVAVRTARKAKTAAARRQRREMAAIMATDLASRERERPESLPESSLDRAELRAIIDAELAALPETHRAAVVLCDLQSKTRAEAAAQLNRPEGTVAAWLARGRKALAARLARRGVSLPAVGLGAVVTPAVVSAELTSAVVGSFLGRGVPESVLALAEGVMRSLSSASTKLAAVVAAAGALVAAVATAAAWSSEPPKPGAPPVATAPAHDPKPEPDMKGFLDHKGYVYSVSYAPDGKTSVSVGNGSAIVWEADTQKKRFTADAEFAAFSGDGKKLFVLTKDEFRTLDAATGKELATKKREKVSERIGGTSAAFTPDGKRYVQFNGYRCYLCGDSPDEPTALADQDTFPAITGGLHFTAIHGGGAFSPDGTVYAGVHRMLAEKVKAPDAPYGSCLSLWDARTGKRLGTLPTGKQGYVHAFAWSPDGKELAVYHAHDARIGSGLNIYNAKTLKQVRKLDVDWVTAIAWSADGKTLAVGREVGQYKNDSGRSDDLTVNKIDVRLLDAQTGKELRRVDGFPDNLPVVSLAFRPDGGQLLSAAGYLPGDGPASNLPKPAKDARGLRVIPLNAKPEAPPATPDTDVSFSPDGTRYLVVRDGAATVYDAATGERLYAVAGEAARFIDGGKTLIVMADKILECDAETGKVVKRHDRPKPAKFAWHAVAFAPDGKTFAAHVGSDVWLHDTAGVGKPTRLKEQFDVGSWVSGITGESVAFSADGKLVLAVGVQLTDGRQRGAAVWDAKTGQRLRVFTPAAKDELRAATFTPDGDEVAIAFKDRVEVWAINEDAKGNPVRTFRTWPATALAYSKDGKQLAVGIRLPIFNGADLAPTVIGHKSEVQLLDTLSGKELKRLDGFEGVNDLAATVHPVLALAFAPDGKKLVAATAGEVKAFDLPAPPEVPAAQKWSDVAVLTDHGALVNGVAVAPDGKSFAAATANNVTCWDAATRKVLWKHRANPVAALAYSPDSKHLAIAGAKAVIRLDAKTGEEDAWSDPAGVNVEGATAIAYSPDGTRLAAGSGPGGIGIYPAGGGKRTGTVGAREAGDTDPLPVGLAWEPDGKAYATSARLKSNGSCPVFVNSLTGRNEWFPFQEHKAPVTALAWSKDGKVIASGDEGGVVILWNPATGKELWRKAIKGRTTDARVNALAISAADNTVAAAVSLGSGKGPDRVVLLAAKDGTDVGFMQTPASIPISSVAWSPDGTFLVTGCGALPGQAIKQSEQAVGEVVVWARKP